MRNRFVAGLVAALTIGGTVAASTSPAAAWCRWGGCGWGGPVAAGIVAGSVLGAAAVAAPRPYPYPYYRPGGYFVCPPGYHFGPQGRACWAN